ncbi:acyl-CoA dehydrogenase [soil metagenome]
MGPLTADQRDLLDLVRAYAGDRLAPRAAADERAGLFPRDLLAELGSMDLMGLPFPEELGGSGQPYGVYLRVVEELARAFLSVGLSLSVHTLSTWAVVTHAPAPLRDRVAHRLTAGEWLGAYSLSEPASGSDAAALSTRAVRDDDAYVVNGTKAWVTHGGEADFYLLLCRTAEHRTRGVSALYVPADTPGLSFAPPERKMGLRSSPTRQVRYDDARVPAGHLLGREGDGFAIAMRALDGGRLGIAACAVGLAQCALDHAVAYARAREQFGRPIGDFQGVGFMLAEMATKVAAARALYLEAAARRDAGREYRRMAAMAKLFATDTAMAVTVDAVQVFGGYGYVADYPVERLMREAKVLQIVEGTNQIQRLVVSRSLLGDGSAPQAPTAGGLPDNGSAPAGA